MDGQIEAAAAALGLVSLLIVARLNPDPELGVVLQAMGAGGAIGLLVAFVRHRDDPDADRRRTVTGFSLLGLAAGTLLVLGERLLFG
ncbi:MAG: hypothetical protein ACRDMA_10350 [Solirubrobacterales bacterium]